MNSNFQDFALPVAMVAVGVLIGLFIVLILILTGLVDVSFGVTWVC